MQPLKIVLNNECLFENLIKFYIGLIYKFFNYKLFLIIYFKVFFSDYLNYKFN